MEMVFNELSLLSPAQSIPQARQRMSQFISSVTALTNQGVNRVLRTDEHFQIANLAPDYSLTKWRNDHDVNRDERQFLRLLTTKAPFLVGLPELENLVLASEFFHQRDDARLSSFGLGYAYLLDTLAVSLPSAAYWNDAEIEVEHQSLEANGEMASALVRVKHCCHPDHVVTHQGWITKQLQTSVQDGLELWDRRNLLFPALSFCDYAAETLRELNGTDPTFRQIVKRLFELEAYCKNWQEGGFDAAKLPSKASTESEATLNQYSLERTFVCPDGVRRVFDWHVRLTPLAWRIHFLPVPNTRQIIVGYVGPHLPTASNPT